MICALFSLFLAVALINPELLFESTGDEAFIEDASYDGTKPLCHVILINPTDGSIIRQLIVQVYQCDECSIHYLDPEDHKKHILFFENAIVDISKIK